MNKISSLIIVSLLLLLLVPASLFTIDQRQVAVILQFGEAVRVIEEPGLNIRIPLIQNVVFIDKRILNVTAEEKELTASDEKRVIVDAFAKYQIIDSVRFIKTVNNYAGANLRLNKLLESAMRTIIGRVPLNALLTEQRSDLMLQIRDLVHKEASFFGIKVIDVRILKSDLPQENSEAIYSRMQTEREKEAKQIRAEGGEESAKIRSRADRESQIILAEAFMKAEKVKAIGDAEAAKLYNKTYAKDNEFYQFYRSLSAYKKSLSKDNTQFILSPKSKFFEHLKISD